MAQEMGVSERAIFRTISSLEEKGFVSRKQESGKAIKYDLQGLVGKLKDMKNAM